MVTKRKIDEVEEAGETKSETSTTPGNSRQMQGQVKGSNKHSIDSDDEEDDRKEEAKFEKMKDDDIEGQEDDTVDNDDGIKITPFNLKEEQQEGSFSKDGNFVWDKKDDIKDAWLDDIDWVKVKTKSKNDLEKEQQEDDEEDEKQGKYNELDYYKKMVEFMKPGESVAKALRRLGGGKSSMSASQRWKKKKAGIVEDPTEKENKEKMLKLTELADGILSRSGNMEIYEETFEGILFKIKSDEEKKVKPKTDVPDNINDEDALDMFADSLDDKTDGQTDNQEADNKTKEQKTTAGETVKISDEVMWEFKWKESDDEIHGPHSSQSMLDWQESGYFSDGVKVRKIGTDQFNDSKRIDFDLYT